MKRQRGGRRRGDDVGATFVEILVAIVLLGTSGVAVLVATTAALTGARTSDQIAKSQATVAEVADYVVDTDDDPTKVEYRACDATSTADIIQAYQDDVDGRFGAGVAEIVAVRFWDAPSSTFTQTCGFASGYRLQEVEIRSVLNPSEQSVTVVKRPLEVPTADLAAAPPVPPYAAGSGQAVVSLTPGINGP